MMKSERMNIKAIGGFVVLAILMYLQGFAQSVPTPGPTQSQAIALVGGTVHIGNGEVLENATVRFDNGKLTAVDQNQYKFDELVKVIDVSGKHIYPGMIAPNTELGLNEINAVRATRDYDEVGAMIPNVRSIVAYNTDSRVIPTIRSNGILLAEISPRGGVISGSSTIAQLDAWNWEDAAYHMDGAIHMNWPSLYSWKGWWAEPGGIEKNEKYAERVDEIMNFFAEAAAYHAKIKPEVTNLKFEAMKGLFDKQKKLLVHANGAREMMAAIELKKQYGLDMVFVGGRDSWMVTDQLKEHNIAVILRPTHSLPSRPEDDIDLPFKTPYLLQQAGINYCLSLPGAWEQRNLPFVAGNAVAYGLTQEEALAAITSNTAKIFGIDDKTGTLEIGKDANIIVSTGDVLDMRTSNIEYAFIQGREINLDNKQKQLYQKFSDKYKKQ